MVDGGEAVRGAGSGVLPAVGDELATVSFFVDRDRLVRYAGASGDFNPIHYNARVATAVGLDDVIAHGMLTMALAGRFVTDWAGDPGAIVAFEVRFTRPVVVPDPGGVELAISGRVGDVDEAAGTVRVDLTATVGGKKVLGKARATVRLR